MKFCHNCGKQNDDVSAFCAECGKPLTAKPVEQPKKAPAKTILQTPVPLVQAPPEPRPAPAPMPAPAQPAAPAPQPAAAAPSRDAHKKTLLGFSGVAGVGPAPQPAPPQPAQAAQPAHAAKAKAPVEMGGEKAQKAASDSAGKTIFGFSPLAAAQQKDTLPPHGAPAHAAHAAKAAPPPAVQAAPLTPQAQQAAADTAGKTILGVSPIQVAGQQDEGAALPTQLASAAPFQEEKPAFEPMMAPPGAQKPRPAQQPQARPQQEKQAYQPPPSAAAAAPAPQPYRPQAAAPQHAAGPRPGGPAQQYRGDVHPAPSAKAEMATQPPTGRPSRVGATTMLMMKKAAAVPTWLIVLIIVVVVGGAGIGFLIKKFVIEPRRPRVARLETRQAADFASLEITIELVNAAAAASIKVAEKTFPVQGQKSVLTLPIGPVRLGPNKLEGMLLDSKGKEKGAVALEFELDYFWQPQTQTLEGDNPVVGIFFQTLPDAIVFIDGQPSPGEGPGKFLYQRPIKELLAKAPPAEGELWKIAFAFEVKGKKMKKSATGSVSLDIPAARLIVDRPMDGAKVAEDKVECIGRTDDGAQVKINGADVPVTAGKFAATIPLPAPKAYEIVIEVFTPTRGPRIGRVKVERVASMGAEVEAFKKSVDAGLTWEKLAREPGAYVGKKILYTGRVFNIRTEQGVTRFQMLVSDGCPKGALCTIVATFRGETSAGEKSLVTLLGEVSGVETLETSTGSKYEAPRIEVKYVLPFEEKGGKGK